MVTTNPDRSYVREVLWWEVSYLQIHVTDLEKVVNRPQAENSELFNVLKIARFATKDEQSYVYQMLLWHLSKLESFGC